jgi:methylglyoxal synthase/pSer/pThr/pTyr-binding forkhead associated (FHA) protein
MKVKVNYSPTLDEVNELDLALATTAKGECIIGRSPNSDLVLDSPDVSRIHGKFFIQSGNYYFCDLGSRNGSVINGKLTEKNRPVLLKDKDVIRIGDYVMTVEDIIPLSEKLPETVFRTIDPALFSSWRANENAKNINVANQEPEVISEVPQEVSSEIAEELSQPQSEVELKELEEAIKALDDMIESPQAVSEVPAAVDDAGTPVPEADTFIQPQDLISPAPEAVSQVPADLDDAGVNLGTPVAEAATFIQPQDLISPAAEAVSQVPADLDDAGVNVGTPVAEAATFIQPQDLISPAPQAVSEVPADINDEDIEWDVENPQEFTIVQPRNIVRQPYQSVSEVPADINDEDINWDAEIFQEFTNVQPRDIVSQPPEVVSEVPADVAEILQEFTIVQPRNIVHQPPEVVNEILEAISAENAVDAVDEFRVDIAAVEAPEFVNSFTPEFSHEDSLVTEDIVIESGDIFSEPSEIVNQVPKADLRTDDVVIGPVTEAEAVIKLSVPVEAPGEFSEVSKLKAATNTEEFSADTRDLETPEAIEFVASTVNGVAQPINTGPFKTVEELEIISNILNKELEDESMPELTSSTSESISQTLKEIFGSEKAQSNEIAKEVTLSEPQQIITQKNIVLIAHESKKSELADFVNQHQEFFSQSFTVAWPSISQVLRQQAGITISQQIPAATSGGYQTINSLVNSGDILAVIFLRDFLVPQTGQANEEALLRSCNINQVLLATNVPTAEAIVYYIKHLFSPEMG